MIFNNLQYYWRVDVDGENKMTLENNTPQKFDNVKIFTADAWHTLQPGKIRNILIWTRDDSQSEGLLFPYHSLLTLCYPKKTQPSKIA